MIWVILAALGVPLWRCAIGLVLILNNRRLRHRRGNIPVRTSSSRAQLNADARKPFY